MEKRNLIFGGFAGFGGLAGLLFMAFTAVNVTVSQSYHGDEGVAQITLQDIVAIAQNGDESAQCIADDPGECAVSCGPNGPCCVGNSPNCSKFQTYSITCDGETLWC